MGKNHNSRQICADRIREVRNVIGETRAEFAKRFNIATSTYAKYETAETQPSLATLIAIADTGGVSTDYLLGRTNDRDQKYTILDDLGITESSAKVLSDISDGIHGNGVCSGVLNVLLNYPGFSDFLWLLAQYFNLGRFAVKGKPNMLLSADLMNAASQDRIEQEVADSGVEFPVVVCELKEIRNIQRYRVIEKFASILDCMDKAWKNEGIYGND